MGYEVAQEDLDSPYILVSGRKGFGVKADDLIDRLIAATRSMWISGSPTGTKAKRNAVASPSRSPSARCVTYMLKYTRNTVIAFDFRDALSFEGETGPYMQYAVVRIRRIFEGGRGARRLMLAQSLPTR